MKLILTLTMLALVASVPTGAAQRIAATYAVTEIGDFIPTGINDSRWVSGQTPSGPGAAVRWTPGSGLTTLAGHGRANGINNAGWIGGWIFGTIGPRAVRWVPNVPVVDMGDIPGGADVSRAEAINRWGWVAGQGSGQYQNDPVYGFLSYNHAGRSKGPGGPMSDLGDLAGGLLSSIGYGINDSGAVAGAASGPDGWVATYWNGNAPNVPGLALGILWARQHIGSNSYAWDVNNLQRVALELPLYAQGETTAAIWDGFNGFIEIGRLPGHVRAAARAINDAGLVVGYSQAGSTIRAFAWTAEDGIVDLSARLDPVLGAGGWTILNATGVSESGLIVATATRPGLPSSGVAVILSPVQCAAFLDVPADHSFCPSVEWIKARSITLGCDGSRYCPESSVIRLAMAAFMQRLGDAMSGEAIVESEAPGALDFADEPVVCTTDDIAPFTAPRHAAVDAIFSGRSNDDSAGFFARIVVSQDRGVSWQALSTRDPRAGVRATQWRSVRAVGYHDMPANHELRFGLRVDRGASTDPASVNASSCRLRVRIGNGTASSL